MVRNKKIDGCHINLEDVKRVIHLYGSDVAVVRGRSVTKRSHKIVKPEIVEMPREILQRNRNVHIYADYMYVHGMPFLTTISSDFKFQTVEPLMNKQKANQDDMVQGINRVIDLYHGRGLKVVQIATDNEFESIRDHIRPIILNVVTADEHVSEIERSIRVIKERVRCQIHSLPYVHYPKNMVAGLVISTVKLFNNEVGACKLSEKYAPHTLITGYNIPNYEELMELTFGEHVEVKNLSNRINSTKARTIPAVALYPSGNLQGGWRMMSLSTGKLIYRSRWVIEQDDNQAEIEDDLSNGNTNEVNSRADYVNEIQPIIDDDIDEGDDNIDNNIMNSDEESVASNVTVEENSETNTFSENDGHNNIDEVSVKFEDQDSNDHDESEIHPREHHQYNLRPIGRVKYQALSDHGETQLHQVELEWYKKMKECDHKKGKDKGIKIKSNDMLRRVTGIVMNQIAKQDRYAQVSVREGVKRHGQRAVDAVLSELTQLNDKNIFAPVSPNSISGVTNGRH